jgi:WD40 repeat protein
MSTFKAHNGGVQRIKQSQFNKDLVASSSTGQVKIWNASINTNWALIRAYTGHTGTVYGFYFINDDTVSSADQTSLQVWSIKTGVKSVHINVSSLGVRCLQYLPSVNGVVGSFLAAGLANGKINIYNIENNSNGSLVKVLSGHTTFVNDLAFISLGSLLASSSSDKAVCIWYLDTTTLKYTLKGHASAVFGINLITSDVLASGSFDFTIKMWNLASGSLIRTLTNHTNYTYWSIDDYLSYDDGRKLLVSGSLDTTIKVWNWETGECLNTINTGLNVISLAAISSTNGNFDFYP